MTNKSSGAATKRGNFSRVIPKAKMKLPKLRGGFIDDSDDDDDTDQESNCGNDVVNSGKKPASDCEHGEDRCDSMLADLSSKQLPLAPHKAALGIVLKPAQRTNRARLLELLGKKPQTPLSKRTLSSNILTGQAIAPPTTDVCQTNGLVRASQGSDSMSSSNSSRKVLLPAQQVAEDHTSRSSELGTTVKSAPDGLRSGSIPHATAITPRLENPPTISNTPNRVTKNTTKPIHGASGPFVQESKSIIQLDPPCQSLRKPSSATSEDGASSSTVAAKRRKQSGAQLPGNIDIVKSVIKGVPQNGPQHNAGANQTPDSILIQAGASDRDDQINTHPQTLRTGSPAQPSQRVQNGTSVEFSQKQSIPIHQSQAAQIVSLTNTSSSKGRPSTIPSPSPPVTTSTPCLITQDVGTHVPKLQSSRSVPSTQKRKAEAITTGFTEELSLTKKPRTIHTQPTHIARSSNGVQDRLKPSTRATPPSEVTSSTTFTDLPRSSLKTTTKSEIPTTEVKNSFVKYSDIPTHGLYKQFKLQAQASRDVSATAKKSVLLASVNTVSEAVKNGPTASQLQTINLDDNTKSPTVQSSASPIILSTVPPLPTVANVYATPSSGVLCQTSEPVHSSLEDAVYSKMQNNVACTMQKELEQCTTVADNLVSDIETRCQSSAIPVSSRAIPQNFPKVRSPKRVLNDPVPTMLLPKSTATGKELLTKAPSQKPPSEIILSTSPALPVDAEPYYEYSIFQKIWSESQTDASVVATELVSRPYTNIDEANAQAERLFSNTRVQCRQYFQVQFGEWSSKRDDCGCEVLTGSFAPIEYPGKKSLIKVWVQRDYVSAYAGHAEKDLKHTSFVAKTVYVLRLFGLITSTAESNGEDTTSTAAVIRVYHPLPRTECYTTFDAANRAAKSLQIELSHVKDTDTMTKVWQDADLEKLNKKMEELRAATGEGERFWESEFNGCGLGSTKYELVVEKVGLCGPRNL